MPNFSEGRDPAVLSALCDAAIGPGVSLADFSADADHNRCVATLVGSGSGVAEAAFRLARVAVERIDIARHEGQHPYIGALDVLPVVPLRNAEIEGANEIAHTIGARIAAELGVPVYFYAFSAVSSDRAPLPVLRKGGLPGLAARMADLPPDAGPPAPHSTAGVSVVGARRPLIAYNVNLDTGDIRIAQRIAARLRESGGGLPGVRALGFYLASRGFAQVSVNITDTRAISMADVYANVREMASQSGVGLAEAELIGCVTDEDLRMNAGREIGCVVRPNQILAEC